MLVVHAPSPLQRPRASAGFTLIELLVVIAMVAILGALAAPSMRNFAANQELSGTTSELMAAAMTARGTAINRNMSVVLEPVGSDWQTGWRIYVTKNASGTYTPGTDELVSVAPPLPDTVAVNGSPPSGCSHRLRFAYNGSGFAESSNWSTPNAGIPLISTVTGRKRCVVFYKTGRTRICGDNADPCESS